MKKKLLLGLCLIAIFVFAGCVSTKMAFVYDPGIPEDQMSFLFVPNYIKVKQFGDKNVEWVTPLLAMHIKVGVPAGEYSFIIDTIITGDNIARVPDIRNKSFTHDFELGKAYQLILQNNEIVIIDL